MAEARPEFRLLLITDRRQATRSLPDLVEEALAAAPPRSIGVQVREKDLDVRSLIALTKSLLPICRARGAPLLVNDRADIAMALGLDGVHLPQASLPAAEARRLLGPKKLLGISCHSLAEVLEARNEGADYATFGPLFDTPSKRSFGPPVGLEALREASEAGLRLYGLGGVTASSVADVLHHGAAGVAVIGAWLAAGSPKEAVSKLLAPVNSADAHPHQAARRGS